MRTAPLYPRVTIFLTGHDGNAFAILATVRSALKHNGAGKMEIDKFVQEATSGDYDHLIQTVMKYVNIE